MLQNENDKKKHQQAKIDKIVRHGNGKPQIRWNCMIFD